jgi:hypothetical protein
VCSGALLYSVPNVVDKGVVNYALGCLAGCLRREFHGVKGRLLNLRVFRRVPCELLASRKSISAGILTAVAKSCGVISAAGKAPSFDSSGAHSPRAVSGSGHNPRFAKELGGPPTTPPPLQCCGEC